MRVLVRTDASAGIGTGHWIRCRSLARALRSIGAEIRFCGRLPEGSFRSSFSKEFPLFPLPQSLKQHVDPGRGVWLPVSEEEDVGLTLSALREEKVWIPDWVVVDHYGLSAIWHHQLRAIWPNVRLAVIDDLADRLHDPDLLIDHNTFRCDTAKRYSSLLPLDREVSLCLGPQFALIDPVHASFRDSVPPRQGLNRLLISLGGAGDTKLLEQILEVLVALPRQSLQIQLVQGGFASDSTQIRMLCEQLGVQKLCALPTLAPLMASADASIGAGGTTTWERLCLGLPCITYALAANQEAYSEALADQGLIEYLGQAESFDSGALRQALLRWQQEPERLKHQSLKGMMLVDGQGCTRIARLMSAATNPQLWSQLVPEVVETGSNWRWSDGLLLKSATEASSGPLRSLDRLQINRHLPQPPTAYLGLPGVLVSALSAVKRVTVVSSIGSWMNRYIPELLWQATRLGCSMRWLHDHRHLQEGDVCFLLSYGRIISEDWLALHRHNLVVHASALPLGKGWSPMTWQILDGASVIPLTLFEAVADLDAGPIHAQEMLQLQGYELAPDWQQLQAQATIRLCTQWLRDYPSSASRPKPQHGEESCFGRRLPEDSRIDPARSLQDQFPLLQVVDNEAYPAFFELKGRRYRLRIEHWV